MNKEQLITIFPRIYHMAEAGSWQSIKEYGLLSTSKLLELYNIQDEKKYSIESVHRPESITITCEGLPPAVVRDQKPMNDADLQRVLLDGITPQKWYEILNSKTFFWATEERLHTLLQARAYRNKTQDVLTINTEALLNSHENDIVLSPYNSGATKPRAVERGYDTFLSIENYPFETWRKKRGSKKKAVVEICVEGGVPNIQDMVTEVRRMQRLDVIEQLYP